MSYNKKENPTRVLFYGKEENEKESRDDKSTQNMVPDAVGTDEWHTALLNAIRAIKKGEFHFRIDEDLPGIYGEISRELNSVAMLSETITDDIQKVNNVITDEGRIDVQIDVKERTGMWKEMVDTINSTITQLTKPNLEVSRVITSVAEGDLSQKMALEYEGVPIKGEFKNLGITVNTMVDQLNIFTSEVTRVAREVGVEGKLGSQAEVPGVAGTWKDLTENVNMLAGNLTGQVRNIALVTTAVAQGDLTQKITIDASGEIQELKNTINTMVDQLSAFGSEVTRVAREVGVEGKLGSQAEVPGVAGTWKDLTENVNMLAGNLTGQVRNIALVTTAVAQGDLTQKITIDASGEIQELKNTINTMVDQLSAFGSEVTRVAREVGVEGKLGAQAEVPGVAGTWKDLTENVNMLAGNLTEKVRNIALVTTAVAQGDLTQKITVDASGEILELKNTINTMVDQLSAFGSEVTRVAREVGVEGKLGAQAEVPGVAGTWKDLTENVNMLAGNLTEKVRNIALVTTAVAQGDLTQKITVDASGEILELKNTINTMVDQLSAFGSEVTRVAREVGTEGKLGGQAEVPGVAGTWKDLTNNVNSMAQSLTSQVRDISRVAQAIAQGDLSQKSSVEAQGEILELKDTINLMVEQLSSITHDVIDVVQAVGEGDLTQKVNIDAPGEFRLMVEGVNATMDSLRRIVSGLTKAGINIDSVSQTVLSAGEEMNAIVSQLTSSTGQIADGARAQANQIADASKESGNVGDTASNTLQQAETMTRMAEASRLAAIEGSRAMEENLRNSEQMLDVSNNSVTSIESLSRSSEQIQEIVDVIRDIATQTNILAINAAIEAVRAGKHGKGFAVVAEEVKTLSADSKTQAKQISDLVKSVQGEIKKTVGIITQLAGNIERGKKSIEQTSQTFGEISQAVQEVSLTASEISTAASDQKHSIDSVSMTLDKISGIAADTSTSSGQVAKSVMGVNEKMQELTSTASTLASMSANLQQTVGQFVLSQKTQPVKE